jgi:hypothetical protein
MASFSDQCIAAGVRRHVKQDAACTDGQRRRIPDDLWAYKDRPSR